MEATSAIIGERDLHRLAILRNEMVGDHLNWIRACDEMVEHVAYAVVDITTDDWMERILEGGFDGLLTQPTGWSSAFKTLYDERTAILANVLGLPLYPSYTEITIYENKKFLSYWLKANRIPHPGTHVFYHQREALKFIERAHFPLVGKTNIGGGGSGVRILHSADEAKGYLSRTFSRRGAPRSVGPKWRKAGFVGRAIRKLKNPAALLDRLQQYRTMRDESQHDFVLLQDHVPHKFEWRVVRIGDSFFAHKKLMLGEKASGSLLKEYGDPPLDLLTRVKEITDKHGLYSQAVDLFETRDGGYLVNEMQCIFGQSDPHQMLVGGVPGRYRHSDGKWIFEAGDFNKYESYLLRLQYFLGTLPPKGSNAAAQQSTT